MFTKKILGNVVIATALAFGFAGASQAHGSVGVVINGGGWVVNGYYGYPYYGYRNYYPYPSIPQYPVYPTYPTYYPAPVYVQPVQPQYNTAPVDATVFDRNCNCWRKAIISNGQVIFQ